MVCLSHSSRDKRLARLGDYCHDKKYGEDPHEEGESMVHRLHTGCLRVTSTVDDGLVLFESRLSIVD